MCAVVHLQHLHIGTLSGPVHIQPIVDALVLPMYGSVLFDTLETGSIIHTPRVPPSSGGVLKTGHLRLSPQYGILANNIRRA